MVKPIGVPFVGALRMMVASAAHETCWLVSLLARGLRRIVRVKRRTTGVLVVRRLVRVLRNSVGVR